METLESITKWIFGISFAFTVIAIGVGWLSRKRDGEKFFNFAVAGLLVLAVSCLMLLFISVRKKTEIKQKVLHSDVITVKEKYISDGGPLAGYEPFIVITDGEDTVTLKVTDGIYEKYKPGDVYEHDADPIQYDAVPSTAPGESG